MMEFEKKNRTCFLFDLRGGWIYWWSQKITLRFAAKKTLNTFSRRDFPWVARTLPKKKSKALKMLGEGTTSAKRWCFRGVDLALNQAARTPGETPMFRSFFVPSVVDSFQKCIGDKSATLCLDSWRFSKILQLLAFLKPAVFQVSKNAPWR